MPSTTPPHLSRVEHPRCALTIDLPGGGRFFYSLNAWYQYYPLTFSSFFVEYHLFGLQPFVYHLDNVLLHALSALLMWLLLAELRLPGAWFAAAIFALHPMQVESVAWIAERKNVLSGVFYLAALLAYLRATPLRERARTRREWTYYAAACLLFVAALLSKTATCSLPLVALLLVWWRRGRLDRLTLLSIVPLVVAGLIMAALTVWIESDHAGASGPDWVFSLLERILIAGRAAWFYVGSFLWPRRLTFIYPRWTIDVHAWRQYLYPVTAIAVIGVFVAARRRGRTGPLVAVLCYAATLAPALGFFNLYFMRYSFVADHFAYLPSIALSAFAVATGASVLHGAQRAVRTAVTVGCGGLLLVLVALTWRQSGTFNDMRTLWADTLEKDPTCWLAHNNLGLLLWQQNEVAEAVAHWRAAVHFNPNDVEAHFNLGAALHQQGQITDAIAEYHEVLRLDPTHSAARQDLGLALAARQEIDSSGH